MVFLLDSSGTISDSQWNKIQKFTEELASGLKVNDDGNKGAVVTFSNTAQVAVLCDSTNTLNEFLKEIRNLIRGGCIYKYHRCIKSWAGTYHIKALPLISKPKCC